ncbi:hypothetical protein SD81_029315 [Tolypothrix campylonemoides VB511288]|nr:hypothetical protein SD81_029315 [Tolypothrix campylonemoides VB511288]
MISMRRKLPVAVFLILLVTGFTLSFLSPSLLGLHQASVRAQTPPVVFFLRATLPNIADHIATAQSRGYPNILSRTTDSGRISRNRREACRNFVPGPAPNTSCDEYPFASTYEGGAGASIRAVPPREQNVQGGILSSFYRQNNIPDRGPFQVVVS